MRNHTDHTFKDDRETLEGVLKEDPQAIADVLSEEIRELKIPDDPDRHAFSDFFDLVQSLHEITIGLPFSKEENPSFVLVRNCLDAAGFQLVVEPKPKR